MKITILLLLIIWITFPTLGQELTKGFIDDSDGFTNIRKEPHSSSEITGKIIEGDRFLYQSDENTNWWKVEHGDIEGYVHKSRIKSEIEIKSEIGKFFLDFYNTDRNNVELGEGNNEKLFLLAKKYPSVLLASYCEQSKEIQKFLISEFESPIHDLIELQVIYTRLNKIDINCSEKQKILKAIRVAGQKIGLKIQ